MIDFATCIPYTLLGLKMLDFISLLKVGRMLSYKSIISMIGLESNFKLHLKLSFLALYFVLIYHSFACFKMLFTSEKWVPPRFYIDINLAK